MAGLETIGIKTGDEKISRRKINEAKNSRWGNSEGENTRKAKFDGIKICDEKNFRVEIYSAEKFAGWKVRDKENV